MIKIKVSEEAADCLAWFAGHPYYSDNHDISEAIIELVKEWFERDGKEYYVKGEYEHLLSR